MPPSVMALCRVTAPEYCRLPSCQPQPRVSFISSGREVLGEERHRLVERDQFDLVMEIDTSCAAHRLKSLRPGYHAVYVLNEETSMRYFTRGAFPIARLNSAYWSPQ